MTFNVNWCDAKESSQVDSTAYDIFLPKINKKWTKSNQTLDLSTSLQEIQGMEEHVK